MVKIVGQIGNDIITASQIVSSQPLVTSGASSINRGYGNDTINYNGSALASNGNSGRDVLILRPSDVINLESATDQSVASVENPCAPSIGFLSKEPLSTTAVKHAIVSYPSKGTTGRSSLDPCDLL